MANALTFVAIGIIILGLVLLAFSLLPAAKEGKVQTKVAAVGFIGPFPIGFGNDKKLLYVALAIGLAIFLANLVFWLMQK